MRIVSLLPSATEIICALGLRDQLVGISHSCDYPSTVTGLPVVTQTVIDDTKSARAIDVDVRDTLGSADALYTLDLETLRALAPDLIVTQALCDVCAVSAGEVEDALCTLPGTPQIVNMEPSVLADVFETISLTAAAAGVGARAADLTAQLVGRIEAVRARTEKHIPPQSRPRVAFIEWLDPPFNGGHWMPELINLAGGIDPLGNPGKPSTTMEWQAVSDAKPDLVFVSCCGFPIDRTLEDIAALDPSVDWPGLVQSASRGVFVSDGNAYFARPGPRLVESLEIMAHACHPDVHPMPDDLEGGLKRIA